VLAQTATVCWSSVKFRLKISRTSHEIAHAARPRKSIEQMIQPEAPLLAADLRALRKSRGVTLTELALKLGRSVGWVSQVERGISRPSIDDLKAIADRPFRAACPAVWPPGGRRAERGVIVRAGHRRALRITSESGLTEELLSPDLGGSFEMLRSEFAPGAELKTPSCAPPKRPATSCPAASTSRSTASGTPGRGRQFPLRGPPVPLAQSGRRAGGRHLGRVAAGLLRRREGMALPSRRGW
jgi:transcriptional regulator with XRE-family HTH domain